MELRSKAIWIPERPVRKIGSISFDTQPNFKWVSGVTQLISSAVDFFFNPQVSVPDKEKGSPLLSGWTIVAAIVMGSVESMENEMAFKDDTRLYCRETGDEKSYENSWVLVRRPFPKDMGAKNEIANGVSHRNIRISGDLQDLELRLRCRPNAMVRENV